MKFLSDILQIIIYQTPPSWNLCLYLFRRKKFAKLNKKTLLPFKANLTTWYKNYILCGCFWVAMARLGAIGPFYIILETCIGHNDWIPQIRANIALIGTGCWKISIFFTLFFEEEVDFLQNYSLKIFEIFIRYTWNNYLSNAAKLEFVSFFV